MTDGEKWFGVGLEPTSKAVIGSQDIPYIYEDRLSEEAVVGAMLKIYNMSKKEREELGRKGREHVMKNYNFENFAKQWDELFTTVHEEWGSWKDRRGHQRWVVKEIEQC